MVFEAWVAFGQPQVRLRNFPSGLLDLPQLLIQYVLGLRGSTPGGVSQWKIYYTLSNGTVATNMGVGGKFAEDPDWGPHNP